MVKVFRKKRHSEERENTDREHYVQESDEVHRKSSRREGKIKLQQYSTSSLPVCLPDMIMAEIR